MTNLTIAAAKQREVLIATSNQLFDMNSLRSTPAKALAKAKPKPALNKNFSKKLILGALDSNDKVLYNRIYGTYQYVKLRLRNK